MPDDNRAALYLRSSKDRNDVSIDAQRRALHDLAVAHKLVVVDEFADAVESGKDEMRPGFIALREAVKSPTRGWSHLCVLDTSRVARKQLIAMAFEHDCERFAVKVLYKNLPDIDPVYSTFMRSIMQAIDELHSMTSKAKGMAGMAENVHQGWRAGGSAPRGYSLEHVPTGAIRDGMPVLKSRLVPNQDAELVAAYLRGRAAGKPRAALVRQLGITWKVDGLNGMEWMALTYAGHTVWGVHAERSSQGGYIGGQKRRPRSEWLIKRDTHPALISDAEAEFILMQIERGRTRRTRESNHPYLLTGLLVDGEGRPWHGEWDVRNDSGMYRLAHEKKVAAHRVDDPVLERILSDLRAPETVDRLLEQMRGQLSEADDAPDGRAIAGKEKRLDALTHKISRLIDLQLDAPTPEARQAYVRSVAQAEAERSLVARELEQLRSRSEVQRDVQALGRRDVVTLLDGLFARIKGGLDADDLEKTKAALGGLVHRIELEPGADTLRICYQVEPLTGFNLASPRGFEPLLSP
ncbi:recombinase family protein [Thiomonas delicata]|uniref:Resolvase/invertase-type recombinase catalytic domain-containing protein n=1 Tax=Thiomonas delicata TaxID=364030 RepID=A0A238D7E5_THIDL|nr:conserved hypothetical protein [Thiomonas delicata]